MKQNTKLASELIFEPEHFGEDTFSVKIGRTTYEVTTHFNTEGRQSVLRQFKDFLLRSDAFRTMENAPGDLYDKDALAVPGCQEGA